MIIQYTVRVLYWKEPTEPVPVFPIISSFISLPDLALFFEGGTILFQYAFLKIGTRYQCLGSSRSRYFLVGAGAVVKVQLPAPP